MTDSPLRVGEVFAEAEFDEPVILVSADGHIGPTLEQMREYCPPALLEDYDGLVAGRKYWDVWAQLRGPLAAMADREKAAAMTRELDRNRQTAGHTDIHAYLADLDGEGIAAQTIYHSSQNGEPIPFILGGSNFFDPSRADTDRAAVGIRIFNRWLADVCTVQPERHIGMIHLPAWDPEASLAEVQWAAAAGLRAVNLPTSRPGVLNCDDPRWEPFWAACQDLGLTVNTHVGGAGGPIDYPTPQAAALEGIDRASSWLCRRHLPRLLFAGVFERYPNLKLVLTEQKGEWWAAAMNEYDAAWHANYWMLAEQVPKPPSEYCRTNVFIGHSYMASFEAATAIHDGYAENVMWGSDYPHAEGTYQYPYSPDDESMTHLSLRFTFSGIEPHYTKMMVSDTALGVYGLDADRLRAVAQRINSPTLRELRTPLAARPEGLASHAFRTMGPAW